SRLHARDRSGSDGPCGRVDAGDAGPVHSRWNCRLRGFASLLRLRCPALRAAAIERRQFADAVAQGGIQPFFKENGNMKTREILLHSLPWAQDILRDLGNTSVKMRVTLSYFIEPTPSERG